VQKLSSLFRALFRGQWSHELVLLLSSLEAAVAVLAASVNELELDVLHVAPGTERDQRLTQCDTALLRAYYTALHHEPVLVDLLVLVIVLVIVLAVCSIVSVRVGSVGVGNGGVGVT
jgi:hypothetical protein